MILHLIFSLKSESNQLTYLPINEKYFSEELSDNDVFFWTLLQVILAEITKYLNLEKLLPSYKYVVTRRYVTFVNNDIIFSIKSKLL